MKLLVDIGNSRVTWTLAHESLLESPRRCRHGECARAWAGLDDRVLLALACSVASADTTRQVLAALPNVPIKRVESAACWGDLVNGYVDPHGLGVDRWLAMIGARTVFPHEGVLIADAGTDRKSVV